MTKPDKYGKHAIGQHIVPFQLTFLKDSTVEEALTTIQKKIGSWPNTESVFIVDKDNKLTGTVEFKILLSIPPKQKLKAIMNKNFEFLTDHSHQQSAIRIAVKRGVESIPVVDQNEHFLGIIDAGQIFKIMHEEHIEKLMHFSGILNQEALAPGYKTGALTVAKIRLPWLLIGLVGGVAATFIIEAFSHTLETELALAFFIPVIVYMNSAVGTQSEIVLIRHSSFEKLVFLKAFLSEVKVSTILGLCLSGLLFIFSMFWIDPRIALVVSLSMFVGILSSAFIGTFVPWVLEKLGKDPAIGSGPFTTIIQDLISIIIYFSTATVLL